jgi:hypothetical protein
MRRSFDNGLHHSSGEVCGTCLVYQSSGSAPSLLPPHIVTITHSRLSTLRILNSGHASFVECTAYSQLTQVSSRSVSSHKSTPGPACKTCLCVNTLSLRAKTIQRAEYSVKSQKHADAYSVHKVPQVRSPLLHSTQGQRAARVIKRATLSNATSSSIKACRNVVLLRVVVWWKAAADILGVVRIVSSEIVTAHKV